MIFLLSFLIAINVSAKVDPTADLSVDVDSQEVQNQEKCKGVLGAGQAIYDKCISDLGKQAEEERKALLEATRMYQSEQPVCFPEKAIKYCQDARDVAAAKNNPSAKANEVQTALINCRSACNPGSSLILSRFLGGCGSSANVQKEKMLALMDKCGYAISEKEANTQDMLDKEPVGKSFAEQLKAGYTGATNRFKEAGLRLGAIGELESKSSFSQVYSTELSDGVEYVKASNRYGTDDYKYRSSDGALHDTFESAQLASERAVKRAVSGGFPPPPPSPSPDPAAAGIVPGKTTNTAEGLDTDNQANALEDESVANAFGDLSPDAKSNLPYSLGQNAPSPATKPITTTKEKMANNNSDSPSTETSTSPSPTTAPLPYQAAVNGAYLQNSLNAPIGGAAASASGEAVSGGSSGGVVSSRSGNSASFGGSSGAIKFDGFGRPLKTLDSSSGAEPAARTAGIVTPSISGAGGTVIPPSSGGINAAGFGGSRIVASSRSASGADFPSFRPENFRSDSFYKTNGSAYSPRSRLVKADPYCRPTKKNPCAMTRVAIHSQSSKPNCDGNPECILKLTGKMKINKEIGIAKNAFFANGDQRAIASVEGQGSDRGSKKLPEGVWSGYIDVLAHINSLSADYLKLDHEGFLATED